MKAFHYMKALGCLNQYKGDIHLPYFRDEGDGGVSDPETSFLAWR